MILTKQQTNALCRIAEGSKRSDLRCIHVCENGVFVTDFFMMCKVTEFDVLGDMRGVIPESQFPLIKSASTLGLGEQWYIPTFDNSFYFEDSTRLTGLTCERLVKDFEKAPCNGSIMDVDQMIKAAKVFKAFKAYPDVYTENGGLRMVAQAGEYTITVLIMGRKNK